MHFVSAHQHVNASGFPLQLAIGNAVRGGSAPGWSVLYEEHAWVLGEENGFIDLVLEDQNKTWLMNVECKRVRDSEWIFLHPIGQSKTRRHAKLWVTHRSGDPALLRLDKRAHGSQQRGIQVLCSWRPRSKGTADA